MSRIGRMPIAIPSGVEVKIDGHVVTVKGAKATPVSYTHLIWAEVSRKALLWLLSLSKESLK